MLTVWIIVISITVLFLLAAVIFLLYGIACLIDEIERIKSWYPFTELLKMRILEDDEDDDDR